jgi:hypothetical protein
MRRTFYLGGGLLALLAVALLFAETFRQPAPAQPPPVAQPQVVGRFQVSSYGYSRSDGATNGAYIVDTQTGEVFQVHGNNPPALIGSVTKPLPTK